MPSTKIPFNSGLISEHGILLSERERTTWTTSGHGPASILTTMVVPTTVTVNTTLIRTTFVTITTKVARHTSTSCADPNSPQCGGILPPIVSHKRNTSLPKVVTGNPSLRTSSRTASPKFHPTTATGAGVSGQAASSMSHAQRHAIIGGLSGTIAGLVIIGLVLCFFLRRRQKRDEESAVGSESSLRETISRNWSQLTGSRTGPRTPLPPPMSSGHATSRPTPPMSRQSSAGEFNGSLLRVSMGHWPRPFAHHESFQESAGPGRLRVMNPDDQSRSTTPAPRGSTESGGTYLQRQRSAITAALFGGGNHSRASSSTPTQQSNLRVPAITVDSAESSECVEHNLGTPSFHSYPSVASFQTVHHQPVEDPFLTPPEGSIEEPQSGPRRPSLATLQNAAGAAGRSLSHFGQALNPFRSRSNTVGTDDSPRHSAMTFSSNGDPFRLDSPSIRGSVVDESLPREAEPAHLRPWQLYEGT